MFSIPVLPCRRSALLLLVGTVSLGSVSAPAWADPRPTPGSSGALATTYAYDAAGYQHEVTDNAGMITRTEYDALGRPTAVIENYVDGSPETGDADEDRTTTYAYNAAGQITQQTADLNDTSGGGGDQVTHYIYSEELSSPTSGGPVPSFGQLRAVVYPDALEDGETRAGVISKLNSATSGDFVETTYYADGALRTRTDQRGVKLTYHYNDDGTRKAQVASSFDADTDDAVQSMTYTYDDLQRLLAVSSHNSAQTAPTATDVVNQVTHEYTGMGQLAKQRQDLDSAVDASTPGSLPTQDILYNYDTSVSGNAYTKALRQTSVTYPNGQQLHTLYDATPTNAGSGSWGAAAIDDALSRPNGLANDAPGSPGTPGDTLVAYAHSGGGTTVIKDLPRILTRLDHTYAVPGESTLSGDYLPGVDRFGRLDRLRWDRVNASTGDPLTGAYGTSTGPLFDLRHGYDDASNRLHTERRVYQNDAEHYTHDALHRLKGFDKGVLENDLSGISHWQRLQQQWELDALGNPLAIDTTDATDAKLTVPNRANEIDDAYVRARQRATVQDLFDSAGTEPDWDVPGSDGFDIDTTNNGSLTFTSAVADTFDGQVESEARAVLLWGHATGPFNVKTQFYIPTGTAAGKFGLVFGYKNANDYWTVTQDLATNKGTVHHVIDGDPGPALSSANYTWGFNTNRNQYVLVTAHAVSGQTFGDYTFPNGLPTGRMGIFSTVPGVRAKFIQVYPQDFAMDVAGRWSSLGVGQQSSAENLYFRPEKHQLGALSLNGVRAQHFDAEFMLKRNSSNSGVYFEFDIDNPNSLTNGSRRSVLHLKHSTSPGPLTVTHNGQVPTTTINTSLPACPNPSDPLWLRVVAEPTSGGGGDTVTVYAHKGGTIAPAWTASDIVYQSTDFGLVGGALAFERYWQGYAQVDDFTLKTWSDTDADGTADAWVTELIDPFNVTTHPGGGAGSFAPHPLEHDAAGNLTYDSNFAYTYDAWNRLVAVTKAYRQPDGTPEGGAIQLGSVINLISYDGLGRRITKRVLNSADFNATEHYYYHGQQLIEIRNGSDLVVKQHVWGLDYIDELIEVALNQDPIDTTEQVCERPFYAVHNAQYNVLGIVEPKYHNDGMTLELDGQRLVERYEYTPYGERQVYSHGWLIEDIDGDGFVWDEDAQLVETGDQGGISDQAILLRCDINGDGIVDGDDIDAQDPARYTGVPQNDSLVLTPSSGTHRSTHTHGGGAGIPLNILGHQGLPHDEETGLVYNRTRYLHPQLGRFVQRDPLGYVDGMSVYGYYAGNEGYVDPTGTSKISAAKELAKNLAKLKQLAGGGNQQLWQIHHILTKSTYRKYGNDLRRLGFEQDSSRNLITLPTPAGKKLANENKLSLGGVGTHKGWTVRHKIYNDRLNQDVERILRDWKQKIITDQDAKMAIKEIRDKLREDLASGAIDVGPLLNTEQTLTSLGPFLVMLPAVQATGQGSDQASLELCEPDIEKVNAMIQEVLAADANPYRITDAAYSGGKFIFNLTPAGDITTIINDGPKLILYSGQTVAATASYTDGVRKINVTWDSLIAESSISGGGLFDRMLGGVSVGGARGSN